VLIIAGIAFIAARTHGPDVDRVLTRTVNYLIIFTCIGVLGCLFVWYFAPPLECRVEVPTTAAIEHPTDGTSQPGSVVAVTPVVWKAGKKGNVRSRDALQDRVCWRLSQP
jgi:hypothetical protein